MSDVAWRRELFPKTDINTQQLKNATVYSNQRRAEKCEQGRRSMKIQILMNRLKSAGNQSTIQCSHLTNCMTHLKQSKSVIFNKSNFLQDFRARISRLFAEHGQSINELEEVVNLLIYRQRQEASCEGRYNQVNIQVQRLGNILEQIRAKVNGKPTRKVLGSFHDIFRTPQNRKMSGVLHDKSRKETINSIFRDGSLLLSFKKNLQEDDGYATLKYSQESNQKHQQKEREGSKEVKMDKRFNRRITEKSEEDVEPLPEHTATQQDLKYHLKGIEYLQTTKVAIETKKKQIQSAFGIYEQLLQKFIEAIAQQKVQSQQQWKKITIQSNQEIHTLKQTINSLKTNSQISALTFQQKLQDLSQSLSNQLHCQRASREDQQKRMINTMLKVVSYFE